MTDKDLDELRAALGDTGDGIPLRVETLEPTGKTLQVPEHLRWYPNEPNRGIGRRAVLILATPMPHGACRECGCALEECECEERTDV